jgi:hypothetical protein
MCRSIKTLRPPFAPEVTSEDIEAAALQYVRKVAGMRQPSRANAAAFGEAVHEIAAATERLLASIAAGGAGKNGPATAAAPAVARH